MERPDDPVARRAVGSDAAELTRLREQMFEALGREGVDGDWRAACEADLADLLVGDSTVAFVVDAPDGSGLACGAVGTLDRRLPSPQRPSVGAVVGHVSSVATDVRWRRRGMARSALTALVDWFAGRGVRSVTLSASVDGESLYRSLGFADPPNPSLRLDLTGRPAGRGSGTSGVGRELTAGDPHA